MRLIPETDAGIIGSEKASLVQVADMVEGENGAVFDLSENSGIFWKNEANIEDNRSQMIDKFPGPNPAGSLAWLRFLNSLNQSVTFI